MLYQSHIEHLIMSGGGNRPNEVQQPVIKHAVLNPTDCFNLADEEEMYVLASSCEGAFLVRQGRLPPKAILRKIAHLRSKVQGGLK